MKRRVLLVLLAILLVFSLGFTIFVACNTETEPSKPASSDMFNRDEYVPSPLIGPNDTQYTLISGAYDHIDGGVLCNVSGTLLDKTFSLSEDEKDSYAFTGWYKTLPSDKTESIKGILFQHNSEDNSGFVLDYRYRELTNHPDFGTYQGYLLYIRRRASGGSWDPDVRGIAKLDGNSRYDFNVTVTEQNESTTISIKYKKEGDAEFIELPSQTWNVAMEGREIGFIGQPGMEFGTLNKAEVELPSEPSDLIGEDDERYTVSSGSWERTDGGVQCVQRGVLFDKSFILNDETKNNYALSASFTTAENDVSETVKGIVFNASESDSSLFVLDYRYREFSDHTVYGNYKGYLLYIRQRDAAGNWNSDVRGLEKLEANSSYDFIISVNISDGNTTITISYKKSDETEHKAIAPQTFTGIDLTGRVVGFMGEPGMQFGEITAYVLTESEYTVTFLDADGESFDTDTVQAGEKVVAPDNTPTKSGNTFIGWKLQSGEEWDFDSNVVAGNIIFVPQYSAEGYTMIVGNFVNENGTLVPQKANSRALSNATFSQNGNGIISGSLTFEAGSNWSGIVLNTSQDEPQKGYFLFFDCRNNVGGLQSVIYNGLWKTQDDGNFTNANMTQGADFWDRSSIEDGTVVTVTFTVKTYLVAGLRNFDISCSYSWGTDGSHISEWSTQDTGTSWNGDRFTLYALNDKINFKSIVVSSTDDFVYAQRGEFEKNLDGSYKTGSGQTLLVDPAKRLDSNGNGQVSVYMTLSGGSQITGFNGVIFSGNEDMTHYYQLYVKHDTRGYWWGIAEIDTTADTSIINFNGGNGFAGVSNVTSGGYAYVSGDTIKFTLTKTTSEGKASINATIELIRDENEPIQLGTLNVTDNSGRTPLSGNYVGMYAEQEGTVFNSLSVSVQD